MTVTEWVGEVVFDNVSVTLDPFPDSVTDNVSRPVRVRSCDKVVVGGGVTVSVWE